MNERVNVERLGDLVKIRTGKLDANANNPNGQYPFFTCAVNNLRIDTYSYDCECVLVAGNGDLNVKYYEGKFDAYQRTYIIESLDKEKLDVRYLYYFMSSYIERLRTMSIGGVIKYIKLGYLTDAQIPLPPLSEQRKIAAVMTQIDKLKERHTQAIQEIDKLMSAAQRTSFSLEAK
jgi:type I restriction enzyme, S subunit